MKHFPVAKTADWALRVRIYPEDRYVSVLNKARSLQKSAVSTQWQYQLDAWVCQVFLFQLIVLLYFNGSPGLPESFYNFVCNSNVYVCGLRPLQKRIKMSIGKVSQSWASDIACRLSLGVLELTKSSSVYSPRSCSKRNQWTSAAQT